MRIFNRPQIPWFLLVVLAAVFSAWIYLGNFHPGRLPNGMGLPLSLRQTLPAHRSVGGTPVGLIFGTISFAIFLFGALLSVRKRMVRLPVGTVQTWMRAHIWLTLLTIPLVLFHSGFRLGAPMTTWLLVLYGIVMASGLYGLFLQHRMPRLMREQLPTETVYEQIPYVRAELLRAAQLLHRSLQSTAAPSLAPAQAALLEEPQSLVDPSSEAALLRFLEDQVMPYLDLRLHTGSRLGDRRYSEDAFRFINLSVAEAYRGRVDEIQSWCEQRRTLDLQVRLHRWLHGWLFVHVPFSFLLILLTAWHAVVTLFYF